MNADKQFQNTYKNYKFHNEYFTLDGPHTFQYYTSPVYFHNYSIHVS